MTTLDDYKTKDGDYSFAKSATADDLLIIIELAAAPDADGRALYFILRHIQRLKLKAKDKRALGAPLAQALLANMAKERNLLLPCLEESLRLHKDLANEFLDPFLDVYVAGPNKGTSLSKLFTLTVKHAQDKERTVRRFEAILPAGSFHSGIGGRKFVEMVQSFYLEHDMEPTSRAVFSPFPASTTEAMARIAELPFVPYKADDKLTFRDPLGTKQKELALGYPARFLRDWLRRIPEGGRWGFRCFDEPTTISFTRGENYLFSNRGYVGAGWVEPYQYDLVIERQRGFLFLVDHETMELTSAGDLDPWLASYVSSNQ